MHALHKAIALLLLSLPVLFGCSQQTTSPCAPGEPSVPRRGGEAEVLLRADYSGAWPSGLDPATNVTGTANNTLMNAIFGGLFQLVAEPDGSHPRIEGDLAERFETADGGRTLIFHLRAGVVFSDGAPFDSAAVRFNIERNLDSTCACAPRSWPWDPHDRVSTPDDLTIVLHFTRPLASIMNAFAATNLNWMVSPAALARLGPDQFRITPVGAGPFVVVSNQLSTKLVLARNPRYWKKDRPYLDRLVFRSIGSEQAAYQALVAGNANAYEAMGSPLLIEQLQARRDLVVTLQPPTSPLVVQLNTSAPPFNDRRAREAIYYATQSEALRKGIFKSWYPVSQSFVGPGGLFLHPTIPGYRTFDIDEARRRVKELSGLHVRLGALRTPIAQQIITALQTQWQAAGIEVTLEPSDLSVLVAKFQSGDWQAMMQTAGSYDPEGGSGLGMRFRSTGKYSGVHDPELDRLLDQGLEAIGPGQRDELYLTVAKYLSDKAYAPFLVAQPSAQVARGIEGPGLTTKIPPVSISTSILWPDVWLSAK